ncbi:MAG: nitroreductase family protein [Anaerolineales bacterium]|nr:nitroreductase family protein [Anaerolineales bacterium]
MTETIRVLQNRYSVRSYADKPIPRDIVDLICNCAMRAPTAGNMQLYSILEIEDQSLKAQLAESCDHQPFIAKAPLVLIFAADYQRWFDYFLHCGVVEYCAERGEELRYLGEGDLMLAACDTLIAAHTAVVAAETLGIGSCYIGDILENYEFHRDLLGLPQYVLPITMVCFGYEKERSSEMRKTPRFPLEVVRHSDRYTRLKGEELEAVYKPRTPGRLPEGIANLGQAFYTRKFSSDFCQEMTRSVRAALQAWGRQEPASAREG